MNNWFWIFFISLGRIKILNNSSTDNFLGEGDIGGVGIDLGEFGNIYLFDE
jgi:hypothetical protein